MTKRVTSHTEIYPPVTLPRAFIKEYRIQESPLRKEFDKYILLNEKQKRMATTLKKQSWLDNENEGLIHADVRSFLDGKFKFMPTDKLLLLGDNYFNLASAIESIVMKRSAFLDDRNKHYKQMILEQVSVTNEMRQISEGSKHTIQLNDEFESVDDTHIGHIVCGILDRFAMKFKADDCNEWKKNDGCPEHLIAEFQQTIEKEVIGKIQDNFINTEKYTDSLIKVFKEIAGKRVMQICQLKASDYKLAEIDNEFNSTITQIKDVVDSMGLEMRNCQPAEVAKNAYTHEHRQGASKEWKPPTPKK